MQTYLWTEDGENKSGYTFWKTLMHEIFPHIIVESKGNCSKLIKAVQNITDFDSNYIIAYDHSFDNEQLIRELSQLKRLCSHHQNIHELKIVSFEYTLLEFSKLIEWIYAKTDEFHEKRRHLIQLRASLVLAIVNQKDYKQLSELQGYISKLDTYNIEKLSSKLLFDLTRNTGFEITKSSLGVCWQTSCCGFLNRQNDDLCGLDESRPPLSEKMKTIYSCSSLKKEFERIGLGGITC